jgi:hypothetical protein
MRLMCLQFCRVTQSALPGSVCMRLCDAPIECPGASERACVVSSNERLPTTT